MYIKTPKRYRGTQRRQVFSCGRFLLILLLFALIALGIGIYQMKDFVQPFIQVAWSTTAPQLEAWQSTQFAPTPLPTVDPSRSLIDGDNNWRAGRVSIALENYRSILATVPNNVEVYSRVTLGLLTRGDLEGARTFAENTVTADPFNADAWAIRALVYAWEGEAAQGIASAQQALALEPSNVRALAFLSYAYFESNLSERARPRAEEAIRLHPNAWEGYWARGLISENIDIDMNAALSDYEIAYQYATEQNPAMAGVMARALSRVLLHPNIGQSQEALNVLNNALTIDPDNVEVLFALGSLYFRDLGEYGQAQDPLSDCTRIAPRNYDCWFLLGRAYERQNNPENALDAFVQSINVGTPYARHYWWAANMEWSAGDCSEASAYLETGYDMVIEGGLGAADEGNSTLIGEFEYLMGLCRVPTNNLSNIEAEVTEESDQ